MQKPQINDAVSSLTPPRLDMDPISLFLHYKHSPGGLVSQTRLRSSALQKAFLAELKPFQTKLEKERKALQRAIDNAEALCLLLSTLGLSFDDQSLMPRLGTNHFTKSAKPCAGWA